MSDPKWLSDEEQHAWLIFAQVIMRVPARLDSQLQRDSGLTHFEYGVLAFLSQAPDRTLRMSHLAGMANGSLSRLSHRVKKLEQCGWVRRSPAPGDGRLTDATLTDAGWEKLVAAAPGHVAQVRTLLIDALTPEQQRQLTGIGQAILARLNPEDPWQPLS